MNLTNQKIEDTYGNVVTMGTAAGQPTTGNLYNGAGGTITSVSIDNVTSLLTNSDQVNTGFGNVQKFAHRVSEMIADGDFVFPWITVVIPGGNANLVRIPNNVVEGQVIRIINESQNPIDVVFNGKFSGLNVGQPFNMISDEKMYTFVFHESSANGPTMYVYS